MTTATVWIHDDKSFTYKSWLLGRWFSAPHNKIRTIKLHLRAAGGPRTQRGESSDMVFSDYANQVYRDYVTQIWRGIMMSLIISRKTLDTSTYKWKITTTPNLNIVQGKKEGLYKLSSSLYEFSDLSFKWEQLARSHFLGVKIKLLLELTLYFFLWGKWVSF